MASDRDASIRLLSRQDDVAGITAGLLQRTIAARAAIRYTVMRLAPVRTQRQQSGESGYATLLMAVELASAVDELLLMLHRVAKVSQMILFIPDPFRRQLLSSVGNG